MTEIQNGLKIWILNFEIVSANIIKSGVLRISDLLQRNFVPHLPKRLLGHCKKVFNIPTGDLA